MVSPSPGGQFGISKPSVAIEGKNAFLGRTCSAPDELQSFHPDRGILWFMRFARVKDYL
jgi:hypothetical protein